MSTIDQVEYINKHYKFDYFFDLGPGCVDTESYILHEINKTPKIIAFEPGIQRFKLLQDSFPGTIYNMAVTNENGIANGFEGGGPLDRSKLDAFRINITTHEHDTENYIVSGIKSVTLDSFTKSESIVGNIFIWADIDGSELLMLKGCTKLLKSHQIVGLNLELCNYDHFPKYYEVISFLKTFNYIPTTLVVSLTGHTDVIFKIDDAS